MEGRKLNLSLRKINRPKLILSKREEYNILVRYAFYQDNNYWIVYSIFMATNGLILSSFILDYWDNHKLIKIGFPIFGLVLCLVWLFIAGRSISYRDHRIIKATTICSFLWDNDKPKIIGLSGGGKASKISMGLIYFMLGIWCFLILIGICFYFYKPEFWWQYGVIIISLILINIIIYILWEYDFNEREREIKIEKNRERGESQEKTPLSWGRSTSSGKNR